LIAVLVAASKNLLSVEFYEVISAFFAGDLSDVVLLYLPPEYTFSPL